MSGPDRLYINQKIGTSTPLVAKVFDQYGVSPLTVRTPDPVSMCLSKSSRFKLRRTIIPWDLSATQSSECEQLGRSTSFDWTLCAKSQWTVIGSWLTISERQISQTLVSCTGRWGSIRSSSRRTISRGFRATFSIFSLTALFIRSKQRISLIFWKWSNLVRC